VPDFEADTTQIADAAVRLGGVAGALSGEYGGIDPGPLGFPQAQAALADFVAAWMAAGDALASGVRALQQGLCDSASRYDGAEGANIQGMRRR
jgi:hypothetical protein